MTRILLVEDDPTFGPFLASELTQQEREIEVRHVESRDAAFEGGAGQDEPAFAVEPYLAELLSSPQ